MKIDNIGLEMLKSFEGCKLKAYKCIPSEKYYTIGYGHNGKDVSKNMIISEEKATELLKKDVTGAELVVNDSVRVPITQSMFNALVSFCYNVGSGNFLRSTLLKKLNKGDYIGCAGEFPKWRKSGGMVLAGLEKRRKEEKTEFLRMGISVETKFPKLSGYAGNSIVDGLALYGYSSSFSYRKKLWEMMGKNDYKGTSKQNTEMLNFLKSL